MVLVRLEIVVVGDLFNVGRIGAVGGDGMVH